MRNPAVLAVLAILCSCSYVPNLATYDQTADTKTCDYSRVHHVVKADMQTGEIFEFGYPGAEIYTCHMVVFGKTERGDFVCLNLADLQDPDVATKTDTLIRKLRLKTGETVFFDQLGGHYYEEGKFVQGTALNLEWVSLPVDRIATLEALKNFKEIESKDGFNTFLGVMGVAGLTVLYVYAKLNSQPQ